MERFERIMRALIVEEGIDCYDIIKAIETTMDESTQEEILEELCSYADVDLRPDDILECCLS